MGLDRGSLARIDRRILMLTDRGAGYTVVAPGIRDERGC